MYRLFDKKTKKYIKKLSKMSNSPSFDKKQMKKTY